MIDPSRLTSTADYDERFRCKEDLFREAYGAAAPTKVARRSRFVAVIVIVLAAFGATEGGAGLGVLAEAAERHRLDWSLRC